ncbi:hypothetical protein [Halococcus sp. PRR34]|uniref:hypothetical protein n=1 Tax=Halococcus sp. PRR34 TaxID=3020830 RepID=UPI0023618396|nr:hypothetical protein [Halococcus sp. PRR34]
MSDQEPSSETLGRRAGEEIGQHLGGLAGRAVGELLTTGLAGVGVPTGSTGGAAADTTTGDRDDTTQRDVDEESETTEERTESDENDESDTGSGRPASRADLEAISYRELQQLAKDVDVTANLAREEMEDRLVETLDLDE